MYKLILFFILFVCSVQGITVDWYLNKSNPAETYLNHGEASVAYFFVGDISAENAVISSIFGSEFDPSGGTIIKWGTAKGSVCISSAGSSVNGFIVIFDAVEYQNANNFIVSGIESQINDSNPYWERDVYHLHFKDSDFGDWQEVCQVPEPSVLGLISLSCVFLSLKRKVKQ